MIDQTLAKVLAEALAGYKSENSNVGEAIAPITSADNERYALVRNNEPLPRFNAAANGQAPVSLAQPVEPSQPSPYSFNGASLNQRSNAAKFVGGTPVDASPELYNHIAKVEQQYGLPAGLLTAIKDKGEKSGSNATSPVGAMGAFQFMPATWKQYGGDASPRDPFAAAEAAGKFFKDLLKMYNGNAAAAVAHYNGGYRQGKLVANGQAPSFTETRNYLNRVLG